MEVAAHAMVAHRKNAIKVTSRLIEDVIIVVKIGQVVLVFLFSN